MRLTRLFTARIRIVWKEIINTGYAIMYDQHSNALDHFEKNAVSDMLRCLSDLKYSENWNQSLCSFNIYHLILLFVKSLLANLIFFYSIV